MKRFFLLLCFVVASQLLNAQSVTTILLPATFKETTNQTLLSYFLPAKELREKLVITEELTDLVNCFSVDSMLRRRIQHHRVIGSRIISILGWNWRSINKKKIKVVGTIKNINNPDDKPHFKEQDVNYNPIPHTKKYIDIFFSAYEAQKKTKRGARLHDITKTPFIYPTDSTINEYRLHCECTPPIKKFGSQLNEYLYPCYSGADLMVHKNFMHAHPTMGLYGAFVLDCNHSCHPEIHPYEWIYWLDLSPQKDSVQDKISWIFGYLRDVSQRQSNWVKKPRSGEISFPFVFKMDNKNKELFIEHNINDKWRHDGFKRIKGIPPDAVNLDFETLVFDIGRPGNSITIKTNKKLVDAAAKLWLSELNVDEKNGYITGNVNLALSMENIYVGRITMTK